MFLPSVAALDDRLLEQLRGTDLLLVDGTFWTDDELHQNRRGTATARSMGHLPVNDAEGSLQLLRQLTDTQISTWVASHFTAQTLGGTTVYDLTVAPSP